MKRRVAAFAGSLIIVAVGVVAAITLSGCDGGSNGGNPTDVPIATDPSGTPISFEAFRDDLADRLDNIGANIGAVPPDVREQLLLQCEQLGNFVDHDAIEPLCRAIDTSIQNDDPGQVDNVVAQLRALEEN